MRMFAIKASGIALLMLAAACGRPSSSADEKSEETAPASPVEETQLPSPQTAKSAAEEFPGAYAVPNPTSGEAVFAKWCAPCHAPGVEHPGTNALTAKYQGAAPGVLLERTDLAPDTVKYFVRNGVSVMPIFRKTEISDEQLDALARYVTRNYQENE